MIEDQRLRGIDFLRGIACLLVVFHHLMFRVDAATPPEWANSTIKFLLSGSFGVAIFFVLSGFLLARPFWLALDDGRPMPSLRIYALRRVARIVPGFWLALTVTFIISFAILGAKLDAQLVARYMAGLLLVSDWHWVSLFPVEFNGPLWSIGFEVSSYLLLPLCFAMLFKLRPVEGRRTATRLLWLAVIVVSLALHCFIVAYAPVDEVDRGWEHGLVGGAKTWMPFYNPIGFFTIFALGSLAASLQVLWRNKSSWTLDIVALLSLAALFLLLVENMNNPTEGYWLFNLPYGFPLFPIATAAFLASAPSSRLVGRLADNRVSRFVAKISFGVYLWHYLVITLMATFIPQSFSAHASDPWMTWLVSSAMAIALSVAIGTFSYYLVERPVVNWSRTLERRRAKNTPVTALADA